MSRRRTRMSGNVMTYRRGTPHRLPHSSRSQAPDIRSTPAEPSAARPRPPPRRRAPTSRRTPGRTVSARPAARSPRRCGVERDQVRVAPHEADPARGPATTVMVSPVSSAPRPPDPAGQCSTAAPSKWPPMRATVTPGTGSTSSSKSSMRGDRRWIHCYRRGQEHAGVEGVGEVDVRGVEVRMRHADRGDPAELDDLLDGRRRRAGRCSPTARCRAECAPAAPAARSRMTA